MQVEPIKADLLAPDEIGALFSKVEERFQRLDVLVNSAGSFKRQEFEAIEVPEWDAVLAVNLRAPFLCTQRAADLMRRSRRPDEEPALVVNMVDLSGIYPWLGHAHHGVSKAGLLHLTKIAARELAPDVRVNAVVPGPILPPPGLDAESAAWRRHGEKIPLKRTGDPLQIGETVVFLARNDFITGESIFVDGGEHLLGAGGRDE